MARHTAFALALKPSAVARQALARHAGCRRFAYNRCVAELKRALDARKADPSVRVPRSSFDFINFINGWRKAQLAQHRAEGKPGKPWCYEVCSQVWEEAAVDASRAYRRFLAGRKPGSMSRPGFPRFRRKNREAPTMRFRARGDCVVVGKDTINLPVLGELRLGQRSRRLRRLLSPGKPTSAKLLFATVTCVAGRWRVRVNLEAQALHPGLCHPPQPAAWVGIDVGLKTFAVAANADGEALWEAQSPKSLDGALRRLRRASRVLHRRKPKSHRRALARQRLAALHARVARIRLDFIHRLSSQVAKNHGHLVLEDLNVAGMLQNRCIARQIADSSWGQFARFVTYKCTWYGSEMARVPRFTPTTKRCSRCDAVVPPLPLSQRVFTCPHCDLVLDRDVNAAANCARWGRAHAHAVADKQSET